MDAGPQPRLGERLFGLDLRSLALFRVGVAAVLLVDLARRFDDLRAHYGDDGVLPIALLPRPGAGASDILLPFSLHVLGGSPLYQAILFVVAAAAGIALLVGWRTRVATIVAWFLTTSLYARNPLVCQAGDTLLRLFLFWAIFLPWGACWSLDARGRPPLPRRLTNMATAALLLQLCAILWFAALLKYDPAWRRDGDAIYRALAIAEMRTGLGDLLFERRGLMTLLTFATLVQEGFVPFLLFVPWKTWIFRLFVVGTFTLFHLSLGLFMQLGYFQSLCILGWLALLPTEFWDALELRRRRRREGAAETAEASAADAAANESAAVAAADAGAIALPATHPPLGVAAKLALPLLLAYVYVENLNHWNQPRAPDDGVAMAALLDLRDAVRRHFPVQDSSLGGVLGLDFTWYLFAPKPPSVHGWFVLDATLNDGRHVDLLPVCMGGRETLVGFARPRRGGPSDPDLRWRKYLDNLIALPPDKLVYRHAFAAYAAETWNRAHESEPGRQLRSLDVVLMRETTLPDYQPPTIEKVRVVKLDGHAPSFRAAAAVDLTPVIVPR
jgi:hypothetical protein